MQNRFNEIESLLETDLKVEATITDEFNTIERGFRDDFTTYYDPQLPALSFECIEANPVDPDFHMRNIAVILEINCRSAKKSTARQKIKELISLVEDFLMSDQWTHAQRTVVGRSGFVSTGSKESGFRANGAIEVTIEVDLPGSTVK